MNDEYLAYLPEQVCATAICYCRILIENVNYCYLYTAISIIYYYYYYAMLLCIYYNHTIYVYVLYNIYYIACMAFSNNIIFCCLRTRSLSVFPPRTSDLLDIIKLFCCCGSVETGGRRIRRRSRFSSRLRDIDHIYSIVYILQTTLQIHNLYVYIYTTITIRCINIL